MIRTTSRCVMGAAALVAVMTTSAMAQDVQYADWAGEIAALQAKLASLETQLDGGGYCEGAACASSCQTGCDSLCGGGCGCDSGCWDCWTRPSCGTTFTAEGLLLRVHNSEGDGDTRLFDGSRFTLGYLNSCGRELRVRFFELGANPHEEADFYNLYTLDFEYAGRFQLGRNWAGEFSLGLRDAKFTEDGDDNYEVTIGPVVGLHLKSAVLWYNTNAYGSLRYSQQFGKEEDNDEYGTFGITEVQVGLERTHCTCAGNFFCRLSLEAQEWAGVDDDDSENLGLIGMGFAIGLIR